MGYYDRNGRSRSRRPDAFFDSFFDDPFWTDPFSPRSRRRDLDAEAARIEAEMERLMREMHLRREPSSPPRPSRRSRSSHRHAAPPPPPPPPRSPSPPPAPRPSRRSRSSTRHANPRPSRPPSPPRAAPPPRPSRTSTRYQPQPGEFVYHYVRPSHESRSRNHHESRTRERDYCPPRTGGANSHRHGTSGRSRSTGPSPMPRHRYVQYEIEELPDDYRTGWIKDPPIFVYAGTEAAD
ncbi:hypothetical protein VTJ49DRAFT_7651 [Mycothermus thermophilus]|uniref:Uncharacterized protein n=1 Tax=Humicola insolens TaxID=85995 RepID=A0ABR3VGE1_HUMIN